ncbi:MAG: ligase-associated DNA damage response endonuclease PdeM [Hyphomicrobiales bacterium]|nr:ligase-associated DNA damage response endonuclease PdeM [Hyphomicrobiales bacterium]
MNAAAEEMKSGQPSLVVAGAELLVDHFGALYEPHAGALIVADLHLEKGSSFARRGMLLPPYDTAATLARLTAAVARWRPRVVIALGDSFHDLGAPDRLLAKDLEQLSALQAGRDWIWIAGNHDPHVPARIGGELRAEYKLGPLTLRHEPSARQAHGEIAGHLHPVAVIGGRRRAFVTDGLRVIAPAFGAYAGGLNLHHPAIARLFSGRRFAHVLGRDGVYAVCASKCAMGA